MLVGFLLSGALLAADGDKGVSVEEIKARMLVEDEQREREKDELLRTALGANAKPQARAIRMVRGRANGGWRERETASPGPASDKHEGRVTW